MGAGMSSRNTANVGKEFHVRDCYVWFEIHYLDSATDYRECLPQNEIHAPIHNHDRILLDPSRDSCRHPCPSWYFLVVFLMVGLIVGCAFLYVMG